jgi:hypothetical protein
MSLDMCPGLPIIILCACYVTHKMNLQSLNVLSVPVSHLDNAELVPWSNTIEHTHIAHNLLQLMFSHGFNLVS